MVRFILSLCLIVCSLGMRAQEWDISVQEADELLGIEKTTKTYRFSVPEDGGIVFWAGEFQFRLFSTNSIFNYKHEDGFVGMSVLIGLYGDDDKLVEKFSMWLDEEDVAAGKFLRTRNAGSLFNPVGQKGRVRKIVQHLNKGKGYVRIVAERYNALPFDIKVLPCSENIDIK